MKRLTVIACLSTILMSPIAAQADWKGTWLAGISGGYNWYDADVDSIVSFPTLNPTTLFTDHRDINTNDWSFGVLGGYQIQCNGWLLGAELSIDWATKHHSQDNVFSNVSPAGTYAFNVSTDYRNDAIIALTTRGGYQILPWLLSYVRAGIETSRNKLDFRIEESVSHLGLSTDVSDRAYRFIGGIGLEVPVPVLCGLTFRAEYDYHSRNKKHRSSGAWEAPIAVVSALSYSNHVNSVKASLVYNFDL